MPVPKDPEQLQRHVIPKICAKACKARVPLKKRKDCIKASEACTPLQKRKARIKACEARTSQKCEARVS